MRTLRVIKIHNELSSRCVCDAGTENDLVVDVTNLAPAVRVIAEWIRRKVCPARVRTHGWQHLLKNLESDSSQHPSRFSGTWAECYTLRQICVTVPWLFASWQRQCAGCDTVCAAYEWKRLYQHVARHRYAASGSQPSLFSSAACRRAGNVSVSFTVNECSSSSVCLILHVHSMWLHQEKCMIKQHCLY